MGSSGSNLGAAAVVGLILAVAAGSHPVTPTVKAATAISYAQAQIGKPYAWGGTGPDSFDCSGLVMMAYRTAGINLPRTSQQQWAAGSAVTTPLPGDLVFFAGADGTTTAPGHVGLVTGGHTMIEAYASGVPIRVTSFGTPDAAPGDEAPVGYTRPTSGAGVP